MPKGPKGEKRPADAISRAVMVMKIATGETQEAKGKPARANSGKGRAKALTPKQRSEIAKAAAEARWKKS